MMHANDLMFYWISLLLWYMSHGAWNTALSCNTCGFFSFWTGAIWHAVLIVVGLFQFNLNLIRGKEPQFIIRIWIILIFTCHIWRTMIWSLFKKPSHWIQTKNTEAQLKIMCPVWCLGSSLLGVVAHVMNVFLSSINPVSYLRTVPCDVAGLFPGFCVSCWVNIWRP